jgi:hypothetical protein
MVGTVTHLPEWASSAARGAVASAVRGLLACRDASVVESRIDGALSLAGSA